MHMYTDFHTATAGRRYALVIGVNGSEQSNFHAELKYAEADAHEIARVLQTPACNFTLVPNNVLSGSAASSEAVRKAIFQIKRTAQSEDTILFYFSGHAITLEKASGRGYEVYLVTSTFNDFEAEEEDSMHISLRYLYEQLYIQAKASQVLLILDCCYAGRIASSGPDRTLTDLLERISNYFQQPTQTSATPQGRLRQALSAASDGVQASEESGSSMTQFLLTALRGEVPEIILKQGYLTTTRLFDYLRDEMPRSAPPSFSGDSGGQSFVLASYPDLSPETREQQKMTQALQQKSDERMRRLESMLIDHSELLKDRLKRFVGRAIELQEIQDKMLQARLRGGIVIVTGQAGQGKSSIISRLIDLEGEQQAIYHFIPLNPGVDHTISLLRHLLARLVLVYKLDDVYIMSDSRAALRDAVDKCLRQISASNRETVIFIDGLDQLEEDMSGRRDLAFLPERPFPGIVFVLGTRPDETIQRLRQMREVFPYELPGLRRPDFDLLLEKHGVQISPPLADYFHEKMAANALYLSLVAQELELSRESALPEEIVQRITDNPDHLFSMAIDRLRRANHQWTTVIKPTLGVLLVAREPLTEPMIRSVLSIDSDALRQGLYRLGGLTIRDGQRRISLYHEKIRDFLRQGNDISRMDFVFADDEEQSLHRQLAAWCEVDSSDLVLIERDILHDTVEQARRSYSREYYIVHLYYARQWLKMWQVLDDGTYGKLKRRYDPSTRSFAHDLDLARQSATRPEIPFEQGVSLLAKLWQYSLLRCSLASRAGSYPAPLLEVMAIIGRDLEAVGIADLLTRPEQRAEVLQVIGAYLCTVAGREQEGRQLLIRAGDIARTIEQPLRRGAALRATVQSLIFAGQVEYATAIIDATVDIPQRQYLLSSGVEALAQCDEWEKAWQFIEKIPIQDQESALIQGNAMVALAHARARAGHWQDAQRVAAQIISPARHAFALIAIAKAMVDQGWGEAPAVTRNAFHMAQTIGEHDERFFALVEIAYTMAQIKDREAEAGALAGARDAIAFIHSPVQRAYTLIDLARRYIWGNQETEGVAFLQEAEKLVGHIELPDKRAFVLVRIARVYGELGRSDDLLNTLTQAVILSRSVNDADERAFVIWEIGYSLVHADQWLLATSLVRMYENIDLRSQLLRDCAQALVQMDRMDEALATARQIEHGWQRAFALAFVAKVALQKSDTAQAERLVEEAVGLVHAPEDAGLLASSLASIVQGLAQADQWAFVDNICVVIKDRQQHDFALAESVRSLAQRKRWVAARGLADRIRGTDERAFALLEVVRSVVEHGPSEMVNQLIEEAKAVIRSVPEVAQRAFALAAAAEILSGLRRQAEAKEFRESALATSAAIEDPAKRAFAVAAVAQSCTAANELNEALRLLNSAAMRAVPEGTEQIFARIDIVRKRLQFELPEKLQKELVSILQELTQTHASTVRDVDKYMEALGVVARLLAAAGALDHAMEAVWDVTATGRRTSALIGIMESCGEQQREVLLEKVKQRPGQQRAELLAACAVVAADQGDPLRAYALLAEANSTEMIGNTSMLATALSRIAQSTASVPCDEKARQVLVQLAQIANLINDDFWQPRAFVAIAQAYSQRGWHELLLPIVQECWRLASTRELLLGLLPMAEGLVTVQPELGAKFAKAFGWVDDFLGMGR